MQTATRITVNARLFACAAKFAAKKDVRYYLNGVYVAPSPNGVGVVMVATCGHRIAVIHDAAGTCDAPAIIANHKRPALAKRGDVSATFDGATAAYSDGLTVAASFIDGRFPDWQAIVPLNVEPCGALNVNPEFLADCRHVCDAFDMGNPGISVASSGPERSMLVTFGDKVPAFLVIMPLRMKHDSTAAPDFMRATAPAADALPPVLADEAAADALPPVLADEAAADALPPVQADAGEPAATAQPSVESVAAIISSRRADACAHLPGADAVKVAIGEALDAGLYYNDDVDAAVRPAQDTHTAFTPYRIAVYDFNDATPQENRRKVSELVAGMPRGAYAIIRNTWADGSTIRYTVAASDGSGKIATGCDYDSHQAEPAADAIAARVLGYECYLLRRQVEAERDNVTHRATVASLGLRVGNKLRVERVAGARYSSATVQDVTDTTVTLLLAKRGSPSRWNWTGPAQCIDLAVAAAAAPPVQAAASDPVLPVQTATNAEESDPVLPVLAQTTAAPCAAPVGFIWCPIRADWLPLAAHDTPPVPRALAEYRRQRGCMVPVLRRVHGLRAGLRDVEFTDRQREQLQTVLDRAERQRNAGLAPLLHARRRWQAHRREICGTQVRAPAQNSTSGDGPVPVLRIHERWSTAAGAWQAGE